MNSQDLNPAIQEMIAEMATMRAELTGVLGTSFILGIIELNLQLSW